MRLLTIMTLILTACSSAPASSPRPTPAPLPTPRAATPATVPTATPARAAATSTPVPDYAAMRQTLLTPLGGLIVAMRSGNNIQFQVNAFEDAAKMVEPRIADDVSPNGNRLHSAIANTRLAIQTKSVGELESVRRTLLEVR